MTVALPRRAASPAAGADDGPAGPGRAARPPDPAAARGAAGIGGGRAVAGGAATDPDRREPGAGRVSSEDRVSPSPVGGQRRHLVQAPE